LLLTPFVRILAIRFGAVVTPSSDARHVHTRPTPTLGGTAMFVGFLAAMAVASHMSQFHEMFQSSSEPFGLIPGAGVMFVVGPLVAIIAVGVCLGFLPFNWHPSKIMMGDAGALFLGVLLAVPTITIGGRTDHAFSGNTFFFFGPLLIPVLILGVPILDTVFSFLRRTINRQRWHQADAGHLHHRLMRLGHGPRRTVVILWAWTALLSGVALVPTYFPDGGSNALVPFLVAA